MTSVASTPSGSAHINPSTARSTAWRLLLASSSAAALLIGGGTPPALAAGCSVVQNGGTVATVQNSSAAGTCIDVENANVTGNVINNIGGVLTTSGVTLPSQTGITVNNSTVGGSVSNAGVINAQGVGVLIEGSAVGSGVANSGTITAHGDGMLVGFVGTFASGVSNSGLISVTGSGAGIEVNFITQFGIAGNSAASGITNSGMITGGDVGVLVGGNIQGFVGTFYGGIHNQQSIEVGGGNGIWVGGNADTNTLTVSSFFGGISNAGTIGAGGTGILVGGEAGTFGVLTVGTFADGISNSGVINAGRAILVGGTANPGGTVSVSAFSGGISNSGTIFSGTGIQVGGSDVSGETTVAVSTFTGGITNSGQITATGPGIFVGGGAGGHNALILIETFGGGISNGGTISAGVAISIGGQANASATGVTISTFAGGITNSGLLTAGTGIGIGGGAGVGISTFLGGITNSGTILGVGANHLAVSINHVGSFDGGIVNALGGSIGAAIVVGSQNDIAAGVSLFTGNISNAGTISASRSAVVVIGVSTFSGNVVNSGAVTAAGVGIVVESVSTFAGGITNAANASITTSATNVGGIVVGGVVQGHAISSNVSFTVGSFSGGVTNAGTISVAGASVGVAVGGVVEGNQTVANLTLGVSNFAGGIHNTGTISAGTAILVGGALQGNTNVSNIAYTVSTFSGGITNDTGGSIAGVTGILVGGFAGGPGVSIAISTFSNGITNNGTISAGTAIFVGGSAAASATGVTIATFAGGISNAGAITAAGIIAIEVGANSANAAVHISTFLGGITNTGTIIDAAANPVAIKLDHIGSFSGDILNATGASIVGAIVVGSPAGMASGVSLFAGNITNAGTISGTPKTGILVTGVSTFTGNIINRGAILGGTSFALAVTNVSTFAGSITNSGTMSIVGAGINVASVGTFGVSAAGGGIVNSGRLVGQSLGIQAQNVSTFLGGITNVGTITAEQAIVLSNVATFQGGISNAAQITGSRTGIVVSSGVGFASGSHIVNSGTISGVTAAINVSAASSAVTIDQTGGLISGAIDLSANADFLNIMGGTISGNVVGAGASDTVNFMLGSGSFTYASPFAMTGLEFANFNSGTVFVDGSIAATFIDVNNGGTAAGTGTLAGAVTVVAGGTLMPGQPLGTLNVSGSVTFNANSFYSVHVTPSTAATTTISGGPGTATINGGTVQVTLQQSGSYHQTYTIVTANSGRTGTFSDLTFTGAFAFNGTDSLSYDADHVFLTLNGATVQAMLTSPGNLTVNQQNVLNGINNGITVANGTATTLPPGFENLFALSGSGLRNALDQLSGQNAAGFFQGAFQAGNSFLGLMVNPFVDGRFGNGFGQAPGFATGFAPTEPPALPQAAAAFASAMPVKAPPPTFDQRFSAWGGAYGGSGNVRGDPVVGSSTTTASVAAFAAGIDYRASPDTTWGFALAGGGTSWSLDSALGGGRSDFFQAGLYGSQHWGHAYLSGALAYNFHDVTTNRTVTIAGTDMLQARFQANGVGARLEGGYRYAMLWLGVTPYAAAQVQSIFLPSYGETATAGSNQFALNFASQNATATRTELGAWFDKTWLDHTTLLDRSASVTLYGRLAWAHDFGDTPSASAIFQSLPGSNFVVNAAAPARDGALVTTGAKYDLMNGWSFTAKFDGEFSSTTSIYSGTGMVRKTW